MTDVAYPALPVAAAPWAAAPAFVLGAGFLETAEYLWAQALALVSVGYQQMPLLVLVLLALVILPLVALLSLAIRRGTRRKARRAALRAAQRRAQVGDWAGQAPAGIGLPAWPSQAWLTIEGKGQGTVPLAGLTVRIGRHEDNDIRLADSSVHRYHAVIQRTPEEAFVITDVSGKEGNGVRVNGERLAQARLADGDLIELGRAKLKFESAPI